MARQLYVDESLKMLGLTRDDVKSYKSLSYASASHLPKGIDMICVHTHCNIAGTYKRFYGYLPSNKCFAEIRPLLRREDFLSPRAVQCVWEPWGDSGLSWIVRRSK